MKTFLFVLCAVLLLVGSLSAQTARPGGIAREAAMGGSQAGSGLVLNPFILDDPTLMFINPAYQGVFRDYAWSNIAGGAIAGTTTTAQDGYGLQNAGAAFGLNDSWTVGAIFSYDPSAVNVVRGLISGGGLVPSLVQGRAPQTIPAVNNVWEAVASTHMNALTLGVGLTYGWSNSDTKSSQTTPASSSSTEASAKMFGIRAGALVDLGGNNALDFSAAFRSDKATDKIDGTTGGVSGTAGDYSASGTEFELAARAKFHISSKFNFIPYGVLAFLSAEPKEDAPPTGATAITTTVKASANAYALGVGGDYRSGGLYLAGGLSFQSAQLKTEVTAGTPGVTETRTFKYSALPVVNIGGEWSFTDWLVGRAGYFRSIGSVNVKDETSTTTDESNSTAGFPVPGFGFTFPGTFSNVAVGGLTPGTWDGIVTLGVGFKFGGWALDATVSDEALRRGLGLIGGGSDNINTFGYLTASYNFAE